MFNRNINPESLPVALAALGEGWHNYHHVFPWDYKTAELGDYAVNFTTLVIDLDGSRLRPPNCAKGSRSPSHYQDKRW